MHLLGPGSRNIPIAEVIATTRSPENTIRILLRLPMPALKGLLTWRLGQVEPAQIAGQHRQVSNGVRADDVDDDPPLEPFDRACVCWLKRCDRVPIIPPMALEMLSLSRS